MTYIDRMIDDDPGEASAIERARLALSDPDDWIELMRRATLREHRTRMVLLLVWIVAGLCVAAGELWKAL